MSKNTAYMSRADAIVLLTAHLAPAMIADHGAGEGTPKRVVDFAGKLADELVAQGVIDGPELDEDKGGPFTAFRASTDDDLDLDEDEEDELDRASEHDQLQRDAKYTQQQMQPARPFEPADEAPEVTVTDTEPAPEQQAIQGA